MRQIGVYPKTGTLPHIAMQENARDMAKFISEVPGKLPRGRFYFDRDERLAKNLLPAFDSKRIPPLPATLFLDGDRVVRQAIVGLLLSGAPKSRKRLRV